MHINHSYIYVFWGEFYIYTNCFVYYSRLEGVARALLSMINDHLPLVKAMYAREREMGRDCYEYSARGHFIARGHSSINSLKFKQTTFLFLATSSSLICHETHTS